jgi:hypothetical protein
LSHSLLGILLLVELYAVAHLASGMAGSEVQQVAHLAVLREEAAAAMRRLRGAAETGNGLQTGGSNQFSHSRWRGCVSE